MAGAKSASFDSFGLGVTNFSQMVSGGLGSAFAGTSGSADFGAVSAVLTSFGTAFDTSNLQKMFTPGGFVASLQKQGLGNVGGLDTTLKDLGVDTANIADADPVLVAQGLQTVTGSDLQKIITQTGMTIPTGSTINSAADLIDAKKIVPVDKLAAIPGGSLDGLNNAITNMGGKFKSAAALVSMVAAVKIPKLPNLDAIKIPMPADVASALTSKLGIGGGPFGNPTVNDIIGTAAGYKHTDSFTTIVANHNTILATTEGAALKAAVDALTADPTNATKLSTFVSAQSAVISGSNSTLTKLAADCQTAIDASTTQLSNESTNQSKAGFSPASAATPPAAQLLAMANKLHDYGLDKEQVGYNFMLSEMATNDQYGDAVKAALIEGKNIASSAAAGIANTTKIDPMEVLKKVQAG